MREAERTVGAQAWAIQAYGPVEDLRLIPIARGVPTGAQVLVEVLAAALNPLDLKLMGGVMAKVMPIAFPFTPGSDVCGTVVALGPDATGVAVGDRIVAMTPAHGAMATHVLCDTQGAVVQAPEGDPAALASLPEAGMTALAVLRQAELQPGRTVAIVGATGGVGLLLCQMAHRAGARVVATAKPDDEALVRANGASETIDYTGRDAIEALAARHPDGVDVVVDLIHQFDDLLKAAGAVRSGGRLVSTLMGPDPKAFGGAVEVRYIRLAPAAQDLQRLVDDVLAGALRPTVTDRFAFADVPAAYRTLRDGHVRGKLVVTRS